MENPVDDYSAISILKDNSEPGSDVAFETLLNLEQKGLNLLAILILVEERIGYYKSKIFLNELLIVYMQTKVASCYFS